MMNDQIRAIARAQKAAERGPVLTAMRAWVNDCARVLPLEEQFKSFGSRYRSYRMTWSTSDDLPSSISTFEERKHFINEFGFAVPSAEAIQLVLNHQPLIEIGAGSGAWSRILHDRGADIIATDPRIERNWFEHARYIKPGEMRWYDLQGKTAVRRWPKRNVLCSWPSLGKTWFRQAARAMRPGRILFAVYEEATATYETWDELDRWERVADLELLSWHHCHDRLLAFRKRGNGARQRPTKEEI
jgi:hypothetical protein